MRARHLLGHAAERHPDRTALEFAGKAISYGQLAERATRVCGALHEAGLRPGDAVAVMLPNVPEFAATLAGSLLAGTRLVPMSYLLQPREVRYVLADSDVRCLVTDRSLLPQVEPALAELERPPLVVIRGDGVHGDSDGDHAGFEAWTDAAPAREAANLPAEAPVLTLYTSGTTGAPKGALITDRNVTSQIAMLHRAFPPADDDRLLCVLPLFHVFALNGLLLRAFYERTTVVIHPRFETEAAVDSLVNDRITMFAGVPTMYFFILGHPGARDLSFPALRYGISGGAPMPVEVMRDFEEQFGVPIYEGYGLTETTVAISANQPGIPRVPGTVGKPFEGVEMRVLDERGHEVPQGEVGEIVVRAPNVMAGYHGKPEATAEVLIDGWLHTGDLGLCDHDGYFAIVDRAKDMILMGGYNVYPREIEELLYEVPGVAEAAVIGVPDPARGELVRAVVAPTPGQQVSEDALRSHLERSLARYKLPYDYVFLDELPKGPTGKILKRLLRERWGKAGTGAEARPSGGTAGDA